MFDCANNGTIRINYYQCMCDCANNWRTITINLLEHDYINNENHYNTFLFEYDYIKNGNYYNNSTILIKTFIFVYHDRYTTLIGTFIIFIIMRVIRR